MEQAAEGYYQKVIDLYKENQSVAITAAKAGVSKVKVQRVLITEGLWSSAASRKIGACHEKGWSTERIARELNTSVKNVQAYLPYTKGEYYPGRKGNAGRCAAYRRRKAALREQPEEGRGE